MREIYEANQVIEELGKRYFHETIFAKVKITGRESENPEWKYYNTNIEYKGYKCHPLKLPVSLIDYPHNENWLEEYIHIGDEYIMSLYNVHHQQLMNIQIMMIHYNLTKLEHISPWDRSFDDYTFDYAYGTNFEQEKYGRKSILPRWKTK